MTALFRLLKIIRVGARYRLDLLLDSAHNNPGGCAVQSLCYGCFLKVS